MKQGSYLGDLSGQLNASDDGGDGSGLHRDIGHLDGHDHAGNVSVSDSLAMAALSRRIVDVAIVGIDRHCLGNRSRARGDSRSSMSSDIVHHPIGYTL